MQYLGCNTTRNGHVRRICAINSAIPRQTRTERSCRDSMQVYSEVASLLKSTAATQ